MPLIVFLSVMTYKGIEKPAQREILPQEIVVEKPYTLEDVQVTIIDLNDKTWTILIDFETKIPYLDVKILGQHLRLRNGTELKELLITEEIVGELKVYHTSLTNNQLKIEVMIDNK